jgi:hypothetical protein
VKFPFGFGTTRSVSRALAKNAGTEEKKIIRKRKKKGEKGGREGKGVGRGTRKEGKNICNSNYY